MDQNDGCAPASAQQGQYSNFFKVGYNAAEFVMDFGQFYAGNETENIHTRIVTAPVYVKALIGVLQKAVADYEEKHGLIPSQSD
jgi:hypothetical protein